MMSSFRAQRRQLYGPAAARRRFGDRLRHVLYATLISLALATLFFLEPFDEIIWTAQTDLASQQPSGEIVFVGTEYDLADRNSPERRGELAQALRELDRLGAERIYVDFVFDRASDPIYDQQLANTLRELGNHVTLVNRSARDLERQESVVASATAFSDPTREVLFQLHENDFGFSWSFPAVEQIDAKSFSSLAADLAEVDSSEQDYLPIDYRIRPGDVPKLSFDTLVTEPQAIAAEQVAGKKIVLSRGHLASGATINIPGQTSVPEIMVAIIGAETLIADNMIWLLSWFVIALVSLSLLATLLTTKSQRARRRGYAAITLFLVGIFFISPYFAIRTELSYGFATVIAYGAFRLRRNWQERATLEDQDTGLPTLRAFEFSLAKDATPGAVVVAKIHGYERVLKSLPQYLHATYALKIADRIRAIGPDLELYKGGHYFAWRTGSADRDDLIEHLTGLRALFGSPLQIGEHKIDAGVTFGVAAIEWRQSRHLSAAIAASEETDEAHHPIRFAEGGASEQDELWELSMRARIDAAIASGEVYCVYQPKIDAKTRKVVGVEALVRWEDPERGSIPPLVFINECEKAGRMEHLTRYVLQSACTAGKLLHARGHDITMSVNISATMCSDVGIVQIVRSVLQGTNFDARYLMLEVTETARISDLRSAALVLNQLRTLDLKLSIDDFGVGAANFETLYELPFDELKIDRLFIKNISEDPKARAIATSLVAMGRESRIRVVAEGVEIPGDLEILNEIGCDEMQGYAISRPIRLDNLLIFMDEADAETLRNIV